MKRVAHSQEVMSIIDTRNKLMVTREGKSVQVGKVVEGE